MTLKELRDDMVRRLTDGFTVGDVQRWRDEIDAMIEAQHKLMAAAQESTGRPDRADVPWTERYGGHDARPVGEDAP